MAIESTADQALERLKQSMSSPFALFISGLELGDLDGISLLESVKVLSPTTRRMLCVPYDKPDALIEAANTVSINACITYHEGVGSKSC